MLTAIFSSLEDEEAFHHLLCMRMMYLCPITFLFLRYVFPPNWGKNFQTLLGPTIPPRIGWCLFEIPNLYWAALCYWTATAPIQTPNKILLGLFVVHYINRSIVYPLTLNPHSKPLPLEIALSAFLYTNINGYIQAQALCQFTTYPNDYLQHPQFWLGLILFVAGVAINWQSDNILRNLRSRKSSNKKASNDDKKSHYVIPHGGLFRYVSAPHYLGELLEWTGYAIACQSLAAWSFVLFGCANLIPRGLAHHEWYLQQFKDYPRERTAVIPFLW